MCGIAGIFDPSGVGPPERSSLERMIQTLAHRGPDGFGFYVSQHAGLAHARLSIIDLAGGAQPIHNEDQSVWVVLNGEIFNYIELRAALEKNGHVFYTRSDTEVIVHLYEEYGCDFVHRLNGQFAIALWDAKRCRLLLIRDRVGIRPLFYTDVGEQLLFASEIKALFACAAVRRRLNPRALGEVFTFWSAIGSETIFENIHALPPGHYLVRENGGSRRVRYWDWTFPHEDASASGRFEDAVAELRELLIDSVRLQLRADVPVGAYLSGGLDSSVIVSLIEYFTDTPLRTFSLTFEDEEFDERRYQQALVGCLHTDHTAVHCTKTAIGEAFPRTVWHTEAPILRTAPTPLLLLSGAVRAGGYKVVLTGEGADEVFAGYDLFKEAKVRRFWAREPESESRPRLLERLYPYLKYTPTAARAYTRRFFGQGMDLSHEPFFGHIPRWLTTRRAWQFFSGEIREALAQWEPYAIIREMLPRDIAQWRPLSRDQYLEAHTLLSGYLLSSQGDRMAMANSIEGRFPFLDHRVVEFGNRLPPRFKLRGLNEKYILKCATRDLLPPPIHQRTKQPYRAPESQSFFRNGQPLDYAAELLGPARLREAGYFDPQAVTRLFEKCRRGDAIGISDNMAFVGILSTMLLDDMFVRPAVVGAKPTAGFSHRVKVATMAEPPGVGRNV